MTDSARVIRPPREESGSGGRGRPRLSAYGEDGLTDSQGALPQSLDRQRNLPPGFKRDMRDVIEENRKAELEQGKNAPKSAWPED